MIIIAKNRQSKKQQKSATRSKLSTARQRFVAATVASVAIVSSRARARLLAVKPIIFERQTRRRVCLLHVGIVSFLCVRSTRVKTRERSACLLQRHRRRWRRRRRPVGARNKQRGSLLFACDARRRPHLRQRRRRTTLINTRARARRTCGLCTSTTRGDDHKQ